MNYEDLYVLKWNNRNALAQPYSRGLGDEPHGRMMVYSKEYAAMAAKEFNDLYASRDQYVVVMPLGEFLGVESMAF